MIPLEDAGTAERSSTAGASPLRRPKGARSRPAGGPMTDHIRQINAAILAHDEWKARLLAAIDSGSSEFQPDAVRADNLCPFGQWFESVEPELRDSLHYERVRTLHAQFHEAAADVLALALSGRGPQALTSLEFGSEFVRASVLLVDELEFWREEMKRG
jgi:hypothetical protein